ncbi:MAG: 6-phosphofructokinase [Kiritimatiellae bacterium]|nr:6-phosphofructokinase [Kiritimatiellia bacterium]
MIGNMLIAQSGGPSMVINQSLIGAVLTAKTSGKIVEIYGALHGIQGIFDEDFIDLRAEPEEVLLRVAQTPSSALGSVRRKPTPEDCKAIFEILARRNIRYFFYIGGNDSAETANIIAQEAERQGYDMCCFHIPKTIDNDLLCNDHTPGYGSAGRFVACAVRGDDLDNRALGGVKIDVIMGRNAGFLTAAAALAKQDEDDGPHLVYVPERPFTVDRFVADVAQCMETYGRCVVAVSEGIRGPDGKAIAESFSTETDAHGNVQLTSGALGENLAAVIRERLKIKRVRADTFGFIQRCFVGITSETDAAEARQAGEEAVKAATSGEHRSGTITINRQPGEAYQVVYAVAPLVSVAKHTRELPAEYINEAGNNVTDAFVAYARPIVGELPVTARFVQLKGRS